MEDQPSASRESPLEAVQPILNATATHPLQDVGEPHKESVSGMEPAATAGDSGGGVVSSQKKNWVKFDDDSGEVNEKNNNQTTTTAATVGTRSTSPSVATVTATAATSSLTAKAAAPTNQLSAQPQPPPRSTVTPAVRPDATAPAVLTTESTHVNLNASGKAQQQNALQQQQQQQQYQKPKASNVLATSHSQQQHQQSLSAGAATAATTTAVAHNNNNNNGAAMRKTPTGSVTIPVETVPPMRTIELSTGRIREGFANGDVIVTLLPANTKWPWITPAIFRPELVPEELMAQGLTLTVEEYVNAMETLVNDYRFTFYNVCYKRVLVCWILFAFAVLLTLLFSGLQGVALFSLGVGWLFLNAAAIFLCMWVKLRLARGLEKCLARVNKQLVKHKILLILDDRGRISCHKVNLCFLYFDATQCVSFLNEFLEHTEQNGGEAIKAGWERKLDIDMNDIIIQGNNPVRLSRKQEHGMQLFLRYASRWGMEALRGLVDVTPLEPGRHCGQFQCPCQYIKDHLQCKPRGKFKCIHFLYWVTASERYD